MSRIEQAQKELNDYREAKKKRHFIDDFHTYYIGVIAEKIREMEVRFQIVLPRGDAPYFTEKPDLDPVLTESLMILQNTFDPKTITDEKLEDVTIEQPLMEVLHKNLKNICFVRKIWSIPDGKLCFSCKRSYSRRMQAAWVKCIECETFWCFKCYARF